MEPVYNTLGCCGLWKTQRSSYSWTALQCIRYWKLSITVPSQRLVLRLAAITPSPLRLGHLDINLPAQIGIWTLNGPSTGTGLPRRWDILTTYVSITWYESGTWHQRSLASPKGRGTWQGPGCKCVVPSFPLSGDVTSYSEDWMASLCSSHSTETAYSMLFPTGAFELVSPFAWNLPQLFAWLSLSILLASTKIHFSSDAYADLCLKQAIAPSLYFLLKTRNNTELFCLFGSLCLYRLSLSLEWLYVVSSVSHCFKLNQ